MNALCCMHAENGSVIDVIVARMSPRARRRRTFTRSAVRPKRRPRPCTAPSHIGGDGRRAGLHRAPFQRRRAATSCKHAQQRGLRAFAETCPQYLLLSHRRAHARQKLGRSEVRLHAAAARKAQPGPALGRAEGRHALQWSPPTTAPSVLTIRRSLGKDDFTKIPNGGPGIENRLQILWHFGVNAGQLTPEKFVELCCTAPARIFGMPQKG